MTVPRILLLLFAVAPVCVQAATFYAGAALGVNQATLNEREQALADRVGVDTRAGLDASYSLTDWGYASRVYGGAWLSPYAGIELRYETFGALEAEFQTRGTTIYGELTQQAQERFSAQAVALAAVGRVPLSAEIALLGRVGFARWRATVDIERSCTLQGSADLCSSFLARAGEHEEWGGGLTWGMGLSWRVAERWTLRGEWDRYNGVGDDDLSWRTDVNLFQLAADYSFDTVPVPAWTADRARLYYGAGLGLNTLENTEWGVGAQVLAGYEEIIVLNRLLIDAELGVLHSGDMDYDEPVGTRVATRLVGPWLAAVARLPLDRDWELLARAGGDFGDDSGMLLGVGAAYEVQPAIRLRVEYVLRENLTAVQFNFTYRP